MKTKEAKNRLEKILPLHERLTDTVESLIRNILNNNNIDYLSVVGRTKNLVSTVEKIKRKKYRNPLEQLTDISGVRIITFFESQVVEIGNLIKDTFEVDEENSLDTDQLLGEDRIGYRSIHYVCSLGKRRESLPEYESIDALKFEIQIRTVLQHAWAELAHDRAYKFSGELPRALQRKLNLYSGNLELIDRGFDEISNEIDAYQAQIDKGDLSFIVDSEIDSINLGSFVNQIAKDNKIKSIEESEIDKKVVRELKDFGIEKISDIENLLTKKFIKTHKKYMEYDTSIGFLRGLMLYSNIDKYFEKSWQNNWGGIDSETIEFLEDKYDQVKLKEIFEKFKIVTDVDEYHDDEIPWDDDE